MHLAFSRQLTTPMVRRLPSRERFFVCSIAERELMRAASRACAAVPCQASAGWEH